MSQRLAKRIPDAAYRFDLLSTVHYEATRAGLDPQMVLGLIEVESGFRKYAVSKSGARGYMQVMPFWTKAIGSDKQDLVSPAHQFALRLHHTALLPGPGKRRSVSRTGTLQRQPGQAGISQYGESRVAQALD